MQLDYTVTSTDLALKSVLFMGFEADFDAYILNFPHYENYIAYQIADNTAAALQWWEGLRQATPPSAILCKLSWLEADNFAFARQIIAHPVLSRAPLVVLARTGEEIDPSTMRNNGIDDCYRMPVEWLKLQQRILYLQAYKPALTGTGWDELRMPEPFQLPTTKRVFDIIGALLGIIISAPLWILVALAIKLESKGPVLYKSKRVGTGYDIFDFLKFRSMYIDADTQIAKLQHLNQYQDGEHPVFLKINRDPRVTVVGRIIRKYSIDELPQLINILRGDMSLVGNRPLPCYEAELLTGEVSIERFRAPAGLTGLWQVSKRGQSNMCAKERIDLDVRYSTEYNAQEYSLWTDLRIIFKTFNALVQQEAV